MMWYHYAKPHYATSVVLGLSLLLTVSPSGSFARNEDDERILSGPPEKIRFYGVRDGSLPEFGGADFHVYGVSRADGTTASKFKGGLNVYEYKFEVTVQFQDLVEGDIVPILGVLFRVNAVVDEGNGVIYAERVDPASIPGGAAVGKETLAVPLKGSVRLGRSYEAFNVSAASVVVRDIKVMENASAPIAIVDGGYELERGGNTCHFRENGIKLRVGDVLGLRDAGLEVVNIIPPNSKTGIKGWVEFSAQPVPAKVRHKDDSGGHSDAR